MLGDFPDIGLSRRLHEGGEGRAVRQPG